MHSGSTGITAREDPLARTATWLRGSRLGLLALAIVVGVGAGFGAVAFRELVFGVTWLATGYREFGQQGRVPSLHFPWLGLWFFLVVPIAGGLLYGPLIQRFAREARGHGVPEVMIAVAEKGGRIRPQVTLVKALASALCIGTGGSVGREGPIVQIGSAFASSVGRLARMSDTRLRILVACGAAGGISATFNAPLTGVFFGFELILREVAVDALFAMIVTAVTADLIGRQFFGDGPIFSQVPHDLVVVHVYSFLLVALLGLMAGLIGVGFKRALYAIEDACDAVWHGRPEWLRPAGMGISLGVTLLVLPELYGVGYPVIGDALAGRIVLGLLLVLVAGKIFASSLTIGIGGSGGVFAPSLFIGAMAGAAFGVIARDIFGAAVGTPAIYGVIAMGAVFGSASQAPLTSISSVVEMTGNYTLTLPVMLAVGIAAAVSKRLTYGTIYTTKLLRRGTDIERRRPGTLMRDLTVADAMQRLEPDWPAGGLLVGGETRGAQDGPGNGWVSALGSVVDTRRPQALLGEESLEQALRQLVLYGPDGLPVLSDDRERLIGWITHRDLTSALARRVSASSREIPQGAVAAAWGSDDPEAQLREPSNPIRGYELVEVAIDDTSCALGRRVADVDWPQGAILAAVICDRRAAVAHPDAVLESGDRALLLAPAVDGDELTAYPPLKGAD
jgi:CIC family chloride channel protein